MGGPASVWVGLHTAKYVSDLSTPLYSDQMCFCTLEKTLKTLQYLFQYQVIVTYRYILENFFYSRYKAMTCIL